MISIGKTAPDFVLKDSDHKEFALQSLRGRFVLLLFYPYDNGFFCTRQFCEYRDDWAKFSERGVTVLGINSGSPDSHKNFKDTNALPFPLLSDTDFSVSKHYGALYPGVGISMRAYVFIAPDGKILYAKSELFPVLKKSLKDLISIIDRCMAKFTQAA